MCTMIYYVSYPWKIVSSLRKATNICNFDSFESAWRLSSIVVFVLYRKCQLHNIIIRNIITVKIKKTYRKFIPQITCNDK